MTHATITAADAGCWLDGAMGWHNTYRVIDRAEGYGFRDQFSADELSLIDDDVRAFRAGSLDDDLAERMHDLADRATDYLQSLAPEGYSFEWDMGELCLWADDDDAEV